MSLILEVKSLIWRARGLLEPTKTTKKHAVVAATSTKKAHHGPTPANPLLVVDTLEVVSSAAGDRVSSDSLASVTIVTPGNRRLSSRFRNSAGNPTSLTLDGLVMLSLIAFKMGLPGFDPPAHCGSCAGGIPASDKSLTKLLLTGPQM